MSVCTRREFYQRGYQDGMNQKWIPVSEHLPPKDKLVLWCGKRGGMFIGSLIFYYEQRQEVYCDVPNSRSNRTGIAWMPLPEPYKE